MSPVQGVASCSCKDTPKGTGVQSRWREGKRTGIVVGTAVVGDVGEVSGKGWDGNQEDSQQEEREGHHEIA